MKINVAAHIAKKVLNISFCYHPNPRRLLRRRSVYSVESLFRRLAKTNVVCSRHCEKFSGGVFVIENMFPENFAAISLKILTQGDCFPEKWDILPQVNVFNSNFHSGGLAKTNAVYSRHCEKFSGGVFVIEDMFREKLCGNLLENTNSRRLLSRKVGGCRR
ncbi:MAG TPA: hypothetical protein VGP55_04835 [Chitinophagaceae bacterium]|nr:hypothetical protein [Chitinophagaceae bacterium]